MTVKPRIAVIIGSTRPTRFADKPAQWILKQAEARGDIDVELVDLRDFQLPFFDEKASNMWMPSENPEAVRWQQTIARFDGFIFVVAEYNHSITAALKNALDEAYKEWGRKPFTRHWVWRSGRRARDRAPAVDCDRIADGIDTRGPFHIGGGDFMAVFPMGGNKPIEDIEAHLLPNTKTALDELVWWAKATIAAKVAD